MSSSLTLFNPDYVIIVEVSEWKDTLTSTSKYALKELITTLTNHGFELNTQYEDKRLLLFVKLNTAALESHVAEVGNSSSEISVSERLRWVYQVLTGPQSKGCCSINVEEGKWPIVKSIVNVATITPTKKALTVAKANRLKIFNKFVEDSEVNFLLKNYGSKYAFYQVFQVSFIKWLVLMTAVGTFFYNYFGRYSLTFAVVNILSTVGFYLFWYFTQVKLGWRWNSSNAYTAVLKSATVDSDYKVVLKQLIFIPIALFFGLFLAIAQLFNFSLEIFLTELYIGPYKGVLSFVPIVQGILTVGKITKVYHGMCTRYVKYESHKSITNSEQSIRIKMILFDFMSNFVPLAISSFVYLPLGFKLNSYLASIGKLLENATVIHPALSSIPLKLDYYQSNSDRLNGQFGFFVGMIHFIGLFLEFVLPTIFKCISFVLGYLKPPSKETVEKTDSKDEELCKDIIAQASLPTYDVDGKFRGLVVQFGFLVLFGPVSPLGPVVPMFVNLLHYKIDYLNFLASKKLPTPETVASIFPWDLCLKYLVLLGSFTSITITFMYRGGDIVTSAEQSPLNTSWGMAATYGFISLFATRLVIAAGQLVIDHVYSNDGPKNGFISDEQLSEILKPASLKKTALQEILSSVNLMIEREAKPANDISEMKALKDEL